MTLPISRDKDPIATFFPRLTLDVSLGCPRRLSRMRADLQSCKQSTWRARRR